jgi:LAO/AO transport system kinase
VTDARDLVARLQAGDRSALARVITRIQRDRGALQLDAELAPATGRAYTVGITGAPGAGKSSLVGAMLLEALRCDRRTAVLALDPESPLSGGAILGDRLRMERAAADDRVFIRSVTAEASAGGLSAATPLIVRALDAAGWPWILLETVGVGQSELAIVEAAATTVVVLTPGTGDEVQAIKAGLMEVGDVFVINKADRPGHADMRRDVEFALGHARGRGWQPLIVDTVATDGSGIAEVWNAIQAHRSHLEAGALLPERRRRLLKLAVTALVMRSVRDRLRAHFDGAEGHALLERLDTGHELLGAACEEVLERLRTAPGD